MGKTNKSFYLGGHRFLIIPLDAQRKNKTIQLTFKNQYCFVSRAFYVQLFRGPMRPYCFEIQAKWALGQRPRAVGPIGPMDEHTQYGPYWRPPAGSRSNMGAQAREKIERKLRGQRNNVVFSKSAQHFSFCVARLMVLFKKDVSLNRGHFTLLAYILKHFQPN